MTPLEQQAREAAQDWWGEDNETPYEEESKENFYDGFIAAAEPREREIEFERAKVRAGIALLKIRDEEIEALRAKVRELEERLAEREALWRELVFLLLDECSAHYRKSFTKVQTAEQERREGELRAALGIDPIPLPGE